MSHPNHTPRLAGTEEALTVLFCLIDDAYVHLNPRSAHSYESIKRLSDSEIVTLALFQQLRGVESERSFLRDAQRFFSHLFPGVARLHPSSFNRRVKKLRRFLEPPRRGILPELVGEPETLLVGLDVARSPPSAPGFSVGRLGKRFGGSRVGKVGLLLGLRSETAPSLRHQPGASLLRAHSGTRGRHLPERGTPRRSGFGSGSSEEALGRPGLQQRAVEDCLGRGCHPYGGNRAGRAAPRGQTANRDRSFEPQEGLWAGRDFGYHAHRVGY